VRVLDLGGLVDRRVQALVARSGYDAMLEEGTFLDVAPVDFVLDRSTERERFRDHVTRGLHWRVLRTGVVRGLGISRPENYYYTLYVLEPASALGWWMPEHFRRDDEADSFGATSPSGLQAPVLSDWGTDIVKNGATRFGPSSR
jgi:hypothetical protein